ncbi:hypothetical protein KUTeg_004589 [Tegillarca granosa]|uniref:Uncharacterized protein n=1 Tax=Tegillarca granosa TaxID=220873 RepID=A0ABQ9FUW9_TEGGR|nr:hypothetical protein KUTeg_004589 [Tegillarca granosa]
MLKVVRPKTTMGQQGTKFVNTIGRYPEGYNARVHGPYSPAVFYGKKDTPFTQVKLEELPKWIGRRRFTPTAMASAFSRAIHRYHGKYIRVRRAGPRPFYFHWWMLTDITSTINEKSIFSFEFEQHGTHTNLNSDLILT